MRTAASNKKVRELINLVKDGKLLPRPEFQRRLVWRDADKAFFLDSVLRGFPFPEIYVADGDVDLETGQGTQLLVDGLQRVSTLVQYFMGDPALKLSLVSPYKDLTEKEKLDFLQYDVAVRDIGKVDRDKLVEVFRRINATKYALSDIEINNAVYAGALKKFAERVADNKFFEEHNIFSALDVRRMGDLRFTLGVIAAMIEGYSNRDDALQPLLERYNDEFPDEQSTDERIQKVFSFIDECGFSPKSRIWRKADMFTLLVEVDRALNLDDTALDPAVAVATVSSFMDDVDAQLFDQHQLASIYYKAALQASNDRGNRVRRGIIVGGLLRNAPADQIIGDLQASGLA